MDDGTEPQGGGKLSRDQPCCAFHCVCRHLGQRLAFCKQGRHLGCDEHGSRIFSSVCHVHCVRSSHPRNHVCRYGRSGCLTLPEQRDHLDSNEHWSWQRERPKCCHQPPHSFHPVCWNRWRRLPIWSSLCFNKGHSTEDWQHDNARGWESSATGGSAHHYELTYPRSSPRPDRDAWWQGRLESVCKNSRHAPGRTLCGRWCWGQYRIRQ